MCPCATGQFDGDGSHVVGAFECDLQGARQAVWAMSQNCPRRPRRKPVLEKRNSQQSNTFAVTPSVAASMGADQTVGYISQ